MSGGHFNYQDSNLKAEIFGYNEKPSNEFEDIEISHLVWDVLDFVHKYDWYICGDTGQEDYLKYKRAFKKKWLRGKNTETIKGIIDGRIDDLYVLSLQTCSMIASQCNE